MQVLSRLLLGQVVEAQFVNCYVLHESKFIRGNSRIMFLTLHCLSSCHTIRFQLLPLLVFSLHQWTRVSCCLNHWPECFLFSIRRLKRNGYGLLHLLCGHIKEFNSTGRWRRSCTLFLWNKTILSTTIVGARLAPLLIRPLAPDSFNNQSLLPTFSYY